VVNAMTGAPLADVKLKLQPPVPPGLPQMGRVAFVTMTEEDGKFAFAGIEAGDYTFSAERSGYLTSVYGARRSTPNGVPLRLGKGENKTGMDLKLTPQGVITGRVIQPDGEPGGNFGIAAARIAYVNGKRQLIRFGPSGGTGAPDDLGEFRIPGLEPGRYYVIATPLPGMGARDLSGRAPEPFQTTFYPAAVDMRDAEILEVAAGATISGIEVHPVRGLAFAVGGHVVNHSGQELRDFQITRPPSSAMSGEMVMGYLLRDAQFQVGDVPRGKITLVASGVNPEGRAVSTLHTIEVSGPVDDLELAINPPFPIPGRLRVENGAFPTGLKVSLVRQDGISNVLMTRSAGVAEDGAFTLPDVTADAYFISVLGLPDGYYVKSVRLGREDVFEGGATFAAKTEQPLEIVLSARAATIRGTVVDAAAGITVALVATDEKRRAQAEFNRSALTDAQGKFTLVNLPPGDYKLFAWEDVENGAWTDPDFLKSIEAQGKPITLHEGEVSDVELKALP
jgi:hypothetical protein